MTEDPQNLYEKRLRRFSALLHGVDGLIAKLTIFDELLKKYDALGEDLWKIDPLLMYFLKSMEVEVILGTAKLLEGPKRSDGNIFKFLDFCASNSRNVMWHDGPLKTEVIFEQKAKIERHRGVINAVMGRRDKSIAHLDKQYLDAPDQLNSDFPLSMRELIDLANEIIMLISEHEAKLHPQKFSFHLAEFFQISVDNMIRNLHAGREKNFGVKLRLY